MRSYRAVAALLALVLHPACAESPTKHAVMHHRTASPLLLADESLWPLDDQGHATVRVCWLAPDLGDETFPDNTTQADLDAGLRERKRWTQEIVEKEWNGRTMLRFVGWKECDGSKVDIEIVPIASGGGGTCGSLGQSCVNHLGRRGDHLSMNLFVGMEMKAIVSRMIERPDQQAAIKESWANIFIPGSCRAEGVLAFNTPSEANLTQFLSIEKRCLQNVAVHEFGHIAGFAHEQNRTDDKEKQKACAEMVERIWGVDGVSTDQDDLDTGAHPLGGFDSESIMSYCRTNPLPDLSPTDLEEANAAYRALLPKVEATSADERDEETDDDDDDDSADKPSSKKKKSSTSSAMSGESGGCNGR